MFRYPFVYPPSTTGRLVREPYPVSAINGLITTKNFYPVLQKVLIFNFLCNKYIQTDKMNGNAK